MSTPTRRQLLDWARDYVLLWNAGDKTGWVRNWRTVAPGEFRMLDPVGTPEKIGFEACALAPWDLFTDGRTTVGHSIETYRFEPNGDVMIRTYYRVPQRTPDELGRMFEEYLPEPH